MIQVTDDNTLRTVTLDRPEKRNALTPDMLHQLAAAFVVTDATRAIAVLGAGKSFCAGFDLKSEPPTEDHALLRAQLDALSKAIIAMRTCPAPVVMGVHGAAVAGGCALLGGADIVIAEDTAKLGYPVVKLGISPAVSCPFLHGALAARARAVTLDPALFTAERAHEMGLVHEIVRTAAPGARADRAAVRTLEVAKSIADKPGDGARATKAWTLRVEDLDAGTIAQGLSASLDALGPDTVARIQKEIFGS